VARTALVAGLPRVGVMALDSDLALEPEMASVLSGEVGVHVSRVSYPGEVSVDALQAASLKVLDAAAQLLPTRPGMLIYACTSGSFYDGQAGNESIEAAVLEATGVPCMTASSAVVRSLRRLAARRIAVISPYSYEVTDRLVSFLNESGFSVTDVAYLFGNESVDDVTLQSVDHSDFQAALDGLKPLDADAVLISCTGMRAVGLLNDLEEAVQRPVITSNAAICRAIMDFAGCEPRPQGILLALPAQSLGLAGGAS